MYTVLLCPTKSLKKSEGSTKNLLDLPYIFLKNVTLNFYLAKKPFYILG